MAELVNAYIDWQLCDMAHSASGTKLGSGSTHIDQLYPIASLPRVSRILFSVSRRPDPTLTEVANVDSEIPPRHNRAPLEASLSFRQWPKTQARTYRERRMVSLFPGNRCTSTSADN